MQVTDIMIPVSEENLQFLKQMGVTHLISQPEYSLPLGYYEFERLIQLRTRIEAAGLRLVGLHDMPSDWNNKIRCGLPGREEQLDNYCRTLENMGRAGIPILGYSFHAVKVWRTSRHELSRGGAYCTGYDHALMENAPLIGPKLLSDEERWEAFEYLLRRVIPVAESAGVKMALHPDDPPFSPVAGCAYIFRSVEAFQRAIDLVPSPSNGLLFCQGCYTEMLGTGVYEAIRHFGRQGKVVYVHYRNVAGSMPKFRETFIDEGDIDMLKAMSIWKEVGFNGPMMPDHYPQVIGDTPYGHRARAHAIGYMKAMMTAVGAAID